MSKPNAVNYNVILESESIADALDDDMTTQTDVQPRGSLETSDSSDSSTFSIAVRNSVTDSRRGGVAPPAYYPDADAARLRDAERGEMELSDIGERELKETELLDLDMRKDEQWDADGDTRFSDSVHEREADERAQRVVAGQPTQMMQYVQPQQAAHCVQTEQQQQQPHGDMQRVLDGTRRRDEEDIAYGDNDNEDDDFTNCVASASAEANKRLRTRGIFSGLAVLCLLLLAAVATLAIVAYTAFNRRSADWALRGDMAEQIAFLDRRISDAVGKVVYFVVDDDGHVTADSVHDCLVSGTWHNASSGVLVNYTAVFNKTAATAIGPGLTLEERGGIVVVCVTRHPNACAPANITSAAEKPVDLGAEIERAVDPVRARVTKLEGKDVYTVDEVRANYAPLAGNVDEANIGRHIGGLIAKAEVYARLGDVLHGIRRMVD